MKKNYYYLIEWEDLSSKRFVCKWINKTTDRLEQNIMPGGICIWGIYADGQELSVSVHKTYAPYVIQDYYKVKEITLEEAFLYAL